jgi:methionine-rich copper-binding protein CopC
MKRFLTLAGAVLLLAFGTSTHALAHAELKRTSPLAKAVLPAAPATVELWLGEEVEPKFSSIEVTGPDGKRVDKGDTRTAPDDAKHLVVDVDASNGPGTYEVKWKATSVDTHKTSGHFHFTVKP